MKNITLSMLLCLTLITACTATEDTTNPVLQADIQLPEQLTLNTPFTLAVTLTNDEQPAEVIFNIWKAGSKNTTRVLQAEKSEDNLYTVTTHFDEEGLYYVQTQISAGELRAMPKKQFIVGKLSDDEINTLTKQADYPKNVENHHH